MAQLEATQEQLTSEITTEIKANQLTIAKISAAHNTLLIPILETKTNKVIHTPGGSEHGELVDMAVAIPEFEARVNAASMKLDQLWAS